MNPVVEQVLLVGQDKKQLAALIVPSQDGLMQFAKDKGVEGFDSWSGLLTQDQIKLLDLLKRNFNLDLQLRSGSRSEERLCGVAFVEPFTIENGLLTQTLKQKRTAICIKNVNAIESIY